MSAHMRDHGLQLAAQKISLYSEISGIFSAGNTNTANILNFPPRGILKIGGGNFGTFSKVDQTVPN